MPAVREFRDTVPSGTHSSALAWRFTHLKPRIETLGQHHIATRCQSARSVPVWFCLGAMCACLVLPCLVLPGLCLSGSACVPVWFCNPVEASGTHEKRQRGVALPTLWRSIRPPEPLLTARPRRATSSGGEASHASFFNQCHSAGLGVRCAQPQPPQDLSLTNH